jgi:hypothetical protein
VVSSLTGAYVRVPKVNVDLCNLRELLSAHCMSKSPEYFFEYYSADFLPPHKSILTCAGSQILSLILIFIRARSEKAFRKTFEKCKTGALQKLTYTLNDLSLQRPNSWT